MKHGFSRFTFVIQEPWLFGPFLLNPHWVEGAEACKDTSQKNFKPLNNNLTALIARIGYLGAKLRLALCKESLKKDFPHNLEVQQNK
jgi:hypothetical protein